MLKVTLVITEKNYMTGQVDVTTTTIEKEVDDATELVETVYAACLTLGFAPSTIAEYFEEVGREHLEALEPRG